MSRRGRQTERRLVTRLAVLAGAALFFITCSGFPRFSRAYTANGLCQDQNYSDPVNLVFDGTYGSAGNTIRGIENHNNWTDTSGSGQNLGVAINTTGSYSCNAMYGQRASGTFTRFHVRIWNIPAATGRLVAGSAHHEDFITIPPCGHAVDSNGSNGSGFDQGRRKLVDGWQAHGHSADGVWWGNTRNFQQCDGDMAGSDGVGVVLNQPHAHP